MSAQTALDRQTTAANRQAPCLLLLISVIPEAARQVVAGSLIQAWLTFAFVNLCLAQPTFVTGLTVAPEPSGHVDARGVVFTWR